MIKLEKTNRGFTLGKFTDRYNEECSIQDSSLATEAALWLGVHDPKPQVLVPGKGWQNVALPEGADISARMHLTVPMARELVILLNRFIERGNIAAENQYEETVNIPVSTCCYCANVYALDGEHCDRSFCGTDCRESSNGSDRQ